MIEKITVRKQRKDFRKEIRVPDMFANKKIIAY